MKLHVHLPKMLIWMLLLIGVGFPEFALANCEGTGPCYCYGAVCSNTPPPDNSNSSSGGGNAAQQQMMMQGAYMLGNAIGEALRGNPEEDARKAREAKIIAEQKKRAEEARKAEALRQQELAKQRILGLLKGTESSGDLKLKTDSDSPLTATTEPSAFGSTAVVPVSQGSPSVGGLQLKLGDDGEKSSEQANQGFDTAGKIMKADLPPPPPTPTSTAGLEKMNLLKAALKKNEDDEKALKALLETLRQSPTPDEAAIKDVQQLITVKENDKKNIKKQLDLTADDDNTEASQPQNSPSARSDQ